MSEFSFIERIRERVAANTFKNADVLFGIGDDCAGLRETSGRELLITTDLLVEDIDFKLSYIPPAWLGHKALAVSMSDIAAMGGTPRFSLLTLAIPVQRAECGMRNAEFWDTFLDGYFALAEAHQVTLIGGDISGISERLAIDSVVMGHCASGQAVRRNGARVGDSIFVSGELGASAVGLQLLLAGETVNAGSNDWRQQAIQAHLRPMPRNAFGEQLGSQGLATAMIDVSDGLAQDLAHLCTNSQVSATLSAQALPLANCVLQFASTQENALQLALNGGEDFELLFTADPANEPALQSLASTLDLRLTRIGEILPADPAHSVWLEDNGARRPLTPDGFDHFAV